MKTSWILFLILFVAAISLLGSSSKGGTFFALVDKGHNFTVTVYDQGSGAPLELVRVLLKRGEALLRVESTNPSGRAVFRDVESGNYTLGTRRLGYVEYADSVLIDETHTSKLFH